MSWLFMDVETDEVYLEKFLPMKRVIASCGEIDRSYLNWYYSIDETKLNI